jgi:hypothetical protein
MSQASRLLAALALSSGLVLSTVGAAPAAAGASGPGVKGSPVSVSVQDQRDEDWRCSPEHYGTRRHWHDKRGHRDDHWDHKQRNGRWQHQQWDAAFCTDRGDRSGR